MTEDQLKSKIRSRIIHVCNSVAFHNCGNVNTEEMCSKSTREANINRIRRTEPGGYMENLREALLKIRKYRRDITVPDHEDDIVYNLANDALNEPGGPKHETVEQWEKRTGETYPDDGPVWSHYRYIMLKNKEEWKVELWGDCKGWEWDSDNPAIVANHHGKPDSEV